MNVSPDELVIFHAQIRKEQRETHITRLFLAMKLMHLDQIIREFYITSSSF